MKILNGIAFTAQPEAPAKCIAGASGWAVNGFVTGRSLLRPSLREHDRSRHLFRW